MASYRRKRLGEILSAKGMVKQEQVELVMAKRTDRSRRIGELLLAEGLITEEALAQSLAEQRDLRYVDLKDYRIRPDYFDTIPVDLMQKHRFVPPRTAGRHS
jgi:type IV pilus assembly protein PilB